MQRGLADQREALRSGLDMMILNEIRPASLLSRRYSVDPLPRTLAKFSKTFASILETRDPSDARALLISSEALVGQIPGRHGFQSYAHAPVLLAEMVNVIRAQYGPETDVTIWFSTRAKAPWQRSVYYQNVRTVRVTDDFESYRNRLDAAHDLDEIVALVRAALPEQVAVRATRLEDVKSKRLGLIEAALDPLGVPTDRLTPPDRQNAQVDGLLEALLKLNRSDLDEVTLVEEKHKVLAQYRKKRPPRPGRA